MHECMYSLATYKNAPLAVIVSKKQLNCALVRIVDAQLKNTLAYGLCMPES